MSSSYNLHGLGLSERCGLWNVEPLPQASQPFLLPDSHLQQGVPLSSGITGTERLMGEVLTFIPYLPKSMVQFETKCRMLSHTNPTPLYLYLTNIYYSSDKCQRFTHVSLLDFELSSMLSR